MCVFGGVCGTCACVYVHVVCVLYPSHDHQWSTELLRELPCQCWTDLDTPWSDWTTSVCALILFDPKRNCTNKSNTITGKYVGVHVCVCVCVCVCVHVCPCAL